MADRERAAVQGMKEQGGRLVGHNFLCQSELILLKGIRYSCLCLAFLKNEL